MASLSFCCNALPAQSIKLGFHQNPNWLPLSSSLNLHTTSIVRFKNVIELPARKRLTLVHASNTPSEEPTGNKEANSSTAQGPPFLTILAGIVAFALVIWAIGSIVSWLFGLLGLLFSK